MSPERLESYADSRLRGGKTPQEVEAELMGFGLDREAAAGMVRNSLDDQWRAEGGGGPALAQIGPRHMILGTLVMGAGVAASLASYYAVINLGSETAYLFYGAVFAGAGEFLYGLMRFFDG